MQKKEKKRLPVWEGTMGCSLRRMRPLSLDRLNVTGRQLIRILTHLPGMEVLHAASSNVDVCADNPAHFFLERERLRL